MTKMHQFVPCSASISSLYRQNGFVLYDTPLWFAKPSVILRSLVFSSLASRCHDIARSFSHLPVQAPGFTHIWSRCTVIAISILTPRGLYGLPSAPARTHISLFVLLFACVSIPASENVTTHAPSEPPTLEVEDQKEKDKQSSCIALGQ